MLAYLYKNIMKFGFWIELNIALMSYLSARGHSKLHEYVPNSRNLSPFFINSNENIFIDALVN